MPRKMGDNTKALEARERKQTAKKAAQDKAQKEADDRLWQDDDKQLAKKKSRKEEEERKKAELLRRKAEAKALLEEEMTSIKPTSKQSIQKITRQQIQQEVEQRNKNVEALQPAKSNAAKVVIHDPLEENLNRAMADTLVATNVDEAIAALSISDAGDDKHPEKRMRAAFRAFESANLPRIKEENPSLRMSQWKQILMKEWNKSPDNPMNNRND